MWLIEVGALGVRRSGAVSERARPLRFAQKGWDARHFLDVVLVREHLDGCAEDIAPPARRTWRE